MSKAVVYSKQHAWIGAITAALIAHINEAAPILFAASILYGTLLGVFMDLDHFLIARLNTGNWDNLKHCLKNPVAALTDQAQVFPEEEVKPRERLTTHSLLLFGSVLTLPYIDLFLANVTILVILTHMIADVIADNWNTRGEN